MHPLAILCYVHAMSKRKRMSPIWEYFQLVEVIIDDKTITKASCLLCDDVELVYIRGNTNRFNHLQCKHLDEYKVLKGKYSSKRQPTIAAFNRSCSPDYTRKLTNRISEFVVCDMRPISTIDGEGFLKLFKLVEPMS